MKTKGKPNIFFNFICQTLGKWEHCTLERSSDNFSFCFHLFPKFPFNCSISQTAVQHAGTCESSVLLLTMPELQQGWLAELQKETWIRCLSQWYVGDYTKQKSYGTTNGKLEITESISSSFPRIIYFQQWTLELKKKNGLWKHILKVNSLIIIQPNSMAVSGCSSCLKPTNYRIWVLI